MLTFTLYEDGGETRAILSGLGGLFTLSGLSAHHDLEKEKEARHILAMKKNRNMSDRLEAIRRADQDYETKNMLYTTVGTVPIIGSVVNLSAYKDRVAAEKAAGIRDKYGNIINRYSK